MPPPNVVFIISDEHNAKCMGHGLQPQARTPHLDRLAGEGVRFSQATTQSPICTPSRISFASGQYPHNHGYYGLAAPLDGPDLTARLPHMYGHFRDAGYAVGAVGTAHVPPGWIDASCHRRVEVKDPEFGYPAFLRQNGVPVERSASLNWGKRVASGGEARFQHDFGPDELPYDLSPEHWVAAQAEDFLEVHGGEPFFLHVGFWRPHTPCTPSPEFWEMYPEAEIAEPPNADYDMSEKSPLLLGKRRTLENLPAGQFVFEPRTYRAMRRRYLRGYLGCVSQVDRAVGEVLAALDRLGLAENTVVVYTSDHGDYAC